MTRFPKKIKFIIFIFTWLLPSVVLPAHAQPYYLKKQTRFHHLSRKQGIRSTVFHDVIQDRNGFIWAVTTQGGRPGGTNLLKFDGYRFKLLGNNFHAKTALGPHSMNQLLEDNDERIWIGQRKELNYFIPSENRFYNCPSKVQSEYIVEIFALFEDSQKRLWVGDTERAYLLDKDTMGLEPLDGPSFGYVLTNWPGIKSFGEDSNGQVWAGSDRGLFKVDDRNMAIVPVPLPDQPEWGDPEIRVIKRKSANELYLGTSNGLWLFNVSEMHVEKIPLPGDASANSIYDILMENGELRWIATAGGLFHFKNAQFTHYVHDEDNEFSLGHNSVRALMFDRAGNLWVATVDGLDVINVEEERFPFYQVSPGYNGQYNYVYRVMEDQFGALWFRHPGAGLTRVDSLGGEYEIIMRNSPRNPHFSVKNSILLPNGKIWTATNGGGIYEIDPLEKVPRQVPLGDSVLTYLNFITNDPIEPWYVWAQSNHGLLRIDYRTLQRTWFDPKASLPWLQRSVVGFGLRIPSGKVYTVLNSPVLGYMDLKTEEFALLDSIENIPPTSVRGMVQDSDGDVWMASRAGLLKVDTSTNGFHLYRTQDGIGLPENNLVSIELDYADNIWLTTQHHICKFDREAFYCFDLRDQAGFFPNVTSGKMADGRLLFGARNGLYVVDPKAFEKETEVPKVFLTDFTFGNESNPLEKSPELLTDLQLDFSQNTCVFEFAALEFFHPENIRYKYRLLGLNGNWTDPIAERRVNFSNLSPGDYTFQVIASSGSGVWSSVEDGLSIGLNVLPPWYRTWAAYAVYFLIAAAILYLLFQNRLRRQLEKQEAARIKEMSEVKTQLYANITHEFRTPLTLILGPANKAKNQLGEMSERELKAHFSTIELNGQILLERVNQLLDLNKIEAGLMECNYEQADVVPFLKYLLESFHSFAETKNINLHFHSEIGHQAMDYDKEKWLTIVSNLLSNALKYTPDGGTVSLSFFKNKNDNAVEIKVADTGIGIPKEKLPLIFGRFYQVDSSDKKTVQGTGIGLALVREYVRLLQGHISVESDFGKGSVFKVVLPLTNDAPLAADMAIKPVPFQPIPATETIDQLAGIQPLVLIIEDQTDVANFIGQCLEKEYRLAFAPNGRTGIERAQQLVPDFIISDVMMPEMNGFEVCIHLKKQELTAHIPIVLLTAKADTQSKIQGLKTGADAYLTKPFNEEELLVRVAKMIELRNALQRKYNSLASVSTPPVYEDAFLIKLTSYIESNLMDYELDVPKICQAMAVSRTQLHRKLKALTGESATRFVRKVRLGHAARLLQETAKPDRFGSGLSGGFQ